MLKDCEVTLEANPDSAVFKELAKLRRAGFNRLSMGVQSANNDILKLIGRRHNWKQAELAMNAAREAGFDNVSCDLIYGLPSQTKGDWADTLMRVIELRPEHISCYGLTLEPGTPMYEKYNGSQILPRDDEQADMYLYAVETLEHYGYKQYEISNFAVPGYESRHNMRYWRLGDYLGFGAGAHSCMDGARFSYVRDADQYIVGVLRDEDIVDEYSTVSSVERGSEYIMLGMRTALGIEAQEYTEHYRADFTPIEKTLRGLRREGLGPLRRRALAFHAPGLPAFKPAYRRAPRGAERLARGGQPLDEAGLRRRGEDRPAARRRGAFPRTLRPGLKQKGPYKRRSCDRRRRHTDKDEDK